VDGPLSWPKVAITKARWCASSQCGGQDMVRIFGYVELFPRDIPRPLKRYRFRTCLRGTSAPSERTSRDLDQVIAKKLSRGLDQAGQIDAVFFCYILKS
jgi:hypothetical protein